TLRGARQNRQRRYLWTLGSPAHAARHAAPATGASDGYDAASCSMNERAHSQEASMNEKVAVVVGGGSGMGAAAARRLPSDGFRIAVLSSSGQGEALGRELGGIGMTGSNQSEEDLARLVDMVLERWGRIDVLVNSAGHGPKGPVLEISDAQWHTGLEV